MNVRKIKASGLLFAAVIAVPLLGAQDAQAPQAPVANIDPNRHGNLAAAQGDIVDAYQRIDMARALTMINWAVMRKKPRTFWRRRTWSFVRQQTSEMPGKTPSSRRRDPGRTTLQAAGQSTRRTLTSPAV